MEVSLGTVIGQIIGLFLVVVIIYFVALIPISLKRIANELAEIREALQKKNQPGQ